MREIRLRHSPCFYIILLFLFTASSCAPKKQILPPPIPKWFISTQSDNLTFYGKGSDERSQNKAIKIALSDIASQLSVSISSTTTSRQRSISTDKHSSSFSDDSINIGARVEELNFRGYSTEKSEYLGGIHYVLVSVNKTELLKSQKANLLALDKKINLSYKVIENASLIQAVKSAKTFRNQIQKARGLITVIVTLDKQFNSIQYENRYDQLVGKVQEKRSELSIYISPGSPPGIEVILGEQISHEQVPIVKNKDGFHKNTYILEISMTSDNKLIFDNYMTTLTIHLILKEQTNNIVANKRYEISGSSLSDFKKSKKQALNKFSKVLKDLDLLEVLGISE